MKKNTVLLFLLASLVFPGLLWAESMIFVTGGMSPPYVYEENKMVMGMDLDVVAEFCKKNGITPEFKAYPWKRALVNVEDGTAHGVFSLFQTKDREEFLYYPTIPVNTIKTVIIARKDRNIKINSLDDLKGKSIGVITEYKYGPEFDNIEGLNKTFCRDKKLLHVLLDKERLDVIIDAEAVFKFLGPKHGLNMDNFEVVYEVVTNPIYIGFSKKALGERGAVLAQEFDRFLRESETNGLLAKIRSKY